MADPAIEAQVVTSSPVPGVALVTLNRPERMNAWTHAMSDQLAQAMQRLDDDGDVRVIVVTGAGRAFCAGADVDGFLARSRSAAPSRVPWRERTLPSTLSTPVVAAINGHAVGVGLSYALHCDVRFVAADAKLGFVFNRRGMVPEVGVHRVLTRVVGHGVASDLLMSGRIITGEEAPALGLASVALPRTEVLPRALAWAEDVATNCNPASVGATKWLMWGSTRTSDDWAIEVEDRLAVAFAGAPGAAEGMTAFREKRPPEWTTTAADGHRDAAEIAAGAEDVESFSPPRR